MPCEGVKNGTAPREPLALPPSFVLMRWGGAAGNANCAWQSLTVSAQRRHFSLVYCGFVKPYLLSEKHSLEVS